MAELSNEWTYWCLVNGLPALGTGILFLVLVPFGKKFAWNVQHRQSAIFLGTGFLMRAAMFVAIILADYWEQIEWMVWGNTVFAGILLGVTMIFGERFVWKRFVAIGWLFLYIEEPVWMLSLVPEAREAAAAAGPLAGAPLQPALVGVLWFTALVMLVVGLYLFFLKKVKKPLWPWNPDLVSLLVLSGWPLSFAVWAATLALAGTWAAARDGVLVTIFWLSIVFISMLAFGRLFNLKQASTRLFLAVNALLLVVLGVGYLLQIQGI